MGIRVTVLSSDRTAPGQYSRYATRVPCPAQAGESEFIDFLVEFGRGQQPNPVLFLTDDASIVAVHRHRRLLENYYRFPMAPWPILRRIMLKDQLYRSLEGVVPLPRTCFPMHERQLVDVARDVGYPALIKPLLRCLSDSADLNGPPFEKLFGSKAVRVHTATALRDAYRTASAHGFRVVVQEEIEGPLTSLYSLGVYAVRQGGIVATFTSQKLGQVPADFGDGLIVRAARAPELIPLGQRVIRHFGYYGMADIEFKWDARAKLFKLLDINPRPWLWINLLTACGVNLSHAAYLDALDYPIDPTLFEQHDFQTRWISMRGCLVSLIRSLGTRRHNEELLGLLRHFRGRRIGPLFSMKDPLFRMFLSPGYWRDAWLQALREIQRLQTRSDKWVSAPQ